MENINPGAEVRPLLMEKEAKIPTPHERQYLRS